MAGKKQKSEKKKESGSETKEEPQTEIKEDSSRTVKRGKPSKGAAIELPPIR